MALFYLLILVAHLGIAYSADCASNGSPCIFPFVYSGSLYTSCTTAGSSVGLWCPTALNPDGSYSGAITADLACTGIAPPCTPPTTTTPAPPCTDMGVNVCTLNKRIVDISARAADLTNRMSSLRSLIRTTATSTTAGDALVVVDATLSSSTKCGPQTITGWTENVDDFYKTASATLETDSSFDPSSGIFKPPVGAGGWYKICAFFRFQNSGNSNDVTIKKDGSVVAAFGQAITADWSSTGTCTIQRVINANSITVHHESGGSSDCIQETGWFYSRFTAHLISCDTATCTN